MYTSHGHPIPGTPVDEGDPPEKARCGAIKFRCPVCVGEARKVQLQAQIDKIEEIFRLVEEGVLGDQGSSEPDYWSWPIVQADKLPEWMTKQQQLYGEVRLYAGSLH